VFEKRYFYHFFQHVLYKRNRDISIQDLSIEYGRLMYTTVGIMGGYEGTLAGMRRIRSSCIGV